jgi:hypothetical protein
MRGLMLGVGCAVLLVAALAPGSAARPGADPRLAPPAPPAQLTDKPWLEEVVRHMYRWYIDERDLDGVIADKQVVFWVRELKPGLDEGDRSLFGEVVLPQFKLEVTVKRADYTIPELGAVVKNDSFRITHVEGTEPGLKRAEGSVEVKIPYDEVRDDLFRTRSQASFPEGDLLERVRAAVRTELAKDAKDHPPGAGAAPAPGAPSAPGAPAPSPTQVVYVAPLSPVANEAWVFWETGRTLIRFASDIDLSNPAVWEHEKLAVKLYHLDSKVVVSLDEVAGSNAFMTRDEAGRALFNCVVLGKRLELETGVPAVTPK